MTAINASPLLLREVAAADDAYQIEKSLRFESGDSAELIKTNSSPGNTRIWTLAFWVKRSGTGQNQWAFASFRAGGGNYVNIGFYDDYLYTTVGGNPDASSNNYSQKVSAAKYRDYGAWMHVVLAFDSTVSTALERHRLYVNGLEVTDLNSTHGSQTCPLNLYTYWNSTYDTEIGSSGNNQFISLYLADVYNIDGYQLSPAAFGEFDSAGNWNPKAFALPAPNDGTNWTSTGTKTGTTANASGSAGWGDCFDGDTTSLVYPATSNGSIKYEFATAKPFSQLRVWVGKNATDGCFIKLNGVDITTTGGFSFPNAPSLDIIDVTGKISSPLSSIEIGNVGGQASNIRAVEIDGVILIDGQTDPTTRNNPHNGTKWSAYLTTSNGDLEADGHAQGPDKAFDGDESTYSQLDNSSDPNSQTFTPPGGIVYKKKVEVYINNTQNTIGINGGTQQSTSQGWNTLATGSGTINTIKVERANANGCSFHGIRVDGVVLIDSTVDNSFHLKFNDTSTNAALGYDALGTDFTESQTAKGGPILKTNIAGTVLTSGTHTDPDDSNLKLGIAGTAFSDTEGGTITASGSVIDTAQSKFYGSSIKFDGSNDYVTCPSGLWGSGGDFTFEAWIYADSVSSGNGNVIFDTGGQGQLILKNVDSANRVMWHAAQSNYARTALGVPVDEWFHLAFCQTNDTRTVFINGKKNTSYHSTVGSPQSADWEGTGALRLGHLSNNNREYFHGWMQDIRIYDKIKYTDSFNVPKRNDFTVNNLTAVTAAAVDYASDITSPNGWYSGSSPGLAVNGNTNNGAESGTPSSGYSTIRFEPDSAITVSSQLRIHSTWGQDGSNVTTQWRINDGSWNSETGTYSSGAWHDLSFTGSLASFELRTSSSNYKPTLQAIEIDGTVLVDSAAVLSQAVDVSVDTPTNYGTGTSGGDVRGNYPTMNPLDNGGSLTLTEGNLQAFDSNSDHNGCRATFKFPSTGKWYYEARVDVLAGANCVGAATDAAANPSLTATGTYYILLNSSGNVQRYTSGSHGATYSGTTTPAVGSIFQCAYDADAEKLWVGFDNQWMDSSTGKTGNPATGANATWTSVTDIFPATNQADSKVSFNFGQRAFEKTVPSGFKALCSKNLPDTFSGNELNNPSKYFDIATYTGTGAARSIKGFNFDPDFVWLKPRSNAGGHTLYDQVRGTTKVIYSHSTYMQETKSEGLTAFNSDGFSLGTGSAVGGNTDGYTYVGWAWDAGDSQAASGTWDTTNNKTYTRWTNATAGFSIVKYEGNGADGGSSGNLIPHGLGATPELILVKNLTASDAWVIYYKGLDLQKILGFDTGAIAGPYSIGTANNYWGKSGGIDATNFTLSDGSSNFNGSGEDNVAYLWTPIEGYSSVGTYSGGGDPTFVYTGMQPRFVMIKCTSHSDSWIMYDSKRNTYNVIDDFVQANNNEVEATGNANKIDILSNGFAVRGAQNGTAGSGRDYVYVAFAEHPFKTARAQ